MDSYKNIVIDEKPEMPEIQISDINNMLIKWIDKHIFISTVSKFPPNIIMDWLVNSSELSWIFNLDFNWYTIKILLEDENWGLKNFSWTKNSKKIAEEIWNIYEDNRVLLLEDSVKKTSSIWEKIKSKIFYTLWIAALWALVWWGFVYNFNWNNSLNPDLDQNKSKKESRKLWDLKKYKINNKEWNNSLTIIDKNNLVTKKVEKNPDRDTQKLKQNQTSKGMASAISNEIKNKYLKERK